MFSPLIPMLFPAFWAHLRKSELLYSGQIWRKRVVSRPIWWLKVVKTWAIWRLSCPMQGFPRTWRRRNQKTGGVEARDEDARGKQPHICWMSPTTTPEKKRAAGTSHHTCEWDHPTAPFVFSFLRRFWRHFCVLAGSPRETSEKELRKAL